MMAQKWYEESLSHYLLPDIMKSSKLTALTRTENKNPFHLILKLEATIEGCEQSLRAKLWLPLPFVSGGTGTLIYSASAKKGTNGRTSIFFPEGCQATGKLSAPSWRIWAQQLDSPHQLRLTWFWWIKIWWKSTALLSSQVQGSLR